MSNDSAAGPIRLLYITEWFEPEPVIKGLRFARALAERGLAVEVATAFPNYPGGKIYAGHRVKFYQKEMMDGIPVHRLFVYPSHDSSGIRRMLTFASFFFSSLFFCLARLKRYDVAYVYHPPIMPAFATALAGIIHRKPFVLEIQDLWPDSVESSGMGRPWVIKLLNVMCNFTYRRAAKIVCQSKGMSKRLIERGVEPDKIVTIYNWSNYVSAAEDASGATFPPHLESAFTGRVNLVYGGNIGQAQALRHVVDAAELASREVPELRLHLIGEGMERDIIKAYVDECAPGTCMVHDAVPPRVMDRIFDRADALVMNLKDDPLYLITIPSKTQHYLSVGKPIVAGIAGEAARLLQTSGATRVVANGDIEGMANEMVATVRADKNDRVQAGENARAFYARELSFESAIEQTMDLVRVVCAEGSGARQKSQNCH